MEQHVDYDCIIVGAGSAGCVLANRLTANPSVRVLLLEAGGRDRHPLIHIPLGLGQIAKHRMFDWGYETESVPSMGGRRIEASRGKVLGGSSSINVMAYVRGNRADYDRWAANGATGWSYAEVLAYFKRCESWEGGESTWRGGSGPLGVIWARSQDPLFAAWVEAARAAGHNFTEDYNGREQIGFGRAQFTIRNGRRASAAAAFLRPALRRPNLTVKTGAQATRVLFERNRAIGVEYVANGRIERVLAGGEVILAGGAFNSPQLLMLSGIGPADHLRDFGIKPRADLPVGRNLQDHLGAQLMWSRIEASRFRDSLRLDRIAFSMARAYLTGTGPATVPPGGLQAFVKLRSESRVPEIQFLFRGAPVNADYWFPRIKPAYDDGFGIRPVLLHPESRGEVKLASDRPLDPVRIVPNFFFEPGDLATLREGFKRAREVAYEGPLGAYRGPETAPGFDVKTDAEIDAWLRRVTITAHHPACTCPMGSGPEAVVDPSLKVLGVEGLRVVDASVMPDLVSGNINAPVMMIAEKAADMIRGVPPLPPVAEVSAVTAGGRGAPRGS
jgi:choline dehydrogenase-like flavoprotein